MSKATSDLFPYMVSIYEVKETPGTLIFEFVPKGPQQSRPPGEMPKRVPEFIVVGRRTEKGLAFDWGRTQDDPGGARTELEAEANRRVEARDAWTHLVTQLVHQAEQWGRELGWSTRVIEKRLDDSYVGQHVLPALLMQEETLRVILEPVGRAVPGAEGVVDLYLLPAYDDIASLLYYSGQWNVHYYFAGAPTPGDVRQTAGMPFSKDTLRRVLEAMRNHAA